MDCFTFTEKEMRRLCASILVQMFKDWKGLVGIECNMLSDPYPNFDSITYHGENYSSIKTFLRSDYGEDICGVVKEHPDRIEKFLDEYRKNRLAAEKERIERRNAERKRRAALETARGV